MLLEEMVLRKQVELLGGGFFSPIFPLIPAADRLGQVELLTTYIRRSFGKRPRGCWLPEYAWESSLASSLPSCGFDYTFLTEGHFRIAGAEPDNLGSPLMTEDQGKSLIVFPVFDAMESFPSPLPIVEALGSLISRIGEQSLYTLMFPGESTRALWAASRLESPDVFIEHSFAALQREALRFETTTPSRFLKGIRDFGRLYFPSCASAQLMERSMAPGARVAASRQKKPPIKSDTSKGFQCAPDAFGSPRRLLLGHEESLAIYAKMHYVRILVGQLRGDKSRKKTAQEELWRGQCGGAYWNAPEGGIARLPVRAAAYSALIEAEKITRQRGSFAPGIVSADIDFNGAKEIIYQGADLNAYIQLRGACLTELDSFKTRTNYINVLDVRDGGPRRLCFRDHFYEKGSFGTNKGNFADARYSIVDGERPASVASLLREDYVEIGGKRRALSVKKTYTFRKGSLSVDYEVENKESWPLPTRVGIEFNLAAGFTNESVSLSGIRAREDIVLESGRKCAEQSLNGFRLCNIAKDEKIEVRSDTPFALSHFPVHAEIADRSPSSYQGCGITLGWDMDIPADSARRLSITLELMA